MEDESAITVYSDKIKECIEAIPERIRLMTEERLRKEVDPNIKLYEVKRAFWEEITRAQGSGRRMIVARVYSGKMGKESFYDMIKDPYKMAWITNPLTTYEDRTQAALDKVTERYDELINMPITSSRKTKDKDENGNDIWIEEVDPKKALVLLQVIRNLEDRIKGTAVQRQVSIHSNRPTDSNGVESGTLDMDAVNKKLIELENKLGGSIDGVGKGDNVASGHEVSGDGEGGDVDNEANGHGNTDANEPIGDNVNAKIVEVKRGDYREIDK